MPASADLSVLLSQPALLKLLSELRGAASAAQPERELVGLLARLTGGGAEIRASWGAVVASAGEAAGGAQTFRLQQGRRHVGRLTLWVAPEWAALGPLAAEYALLSRLQSAAAGSARRRVGERTLSALLSGEAHLGDETFVVALADLGTGATGRGARAQAAQAYALDVLAEVGEGYLLGSGLNGLATVWQGRALWWWPSEHPVQEGASLFAALRESVGGVRLGVSERHRGEGLAAALDEARQALGAVRSSGVQVFQNLDPLTPLLRTEAAAQLRAQLRARLATLQDAGKVETTLRLYLTHTGPLTALAGAQHIHVNTLRYRLKRAEDALGASLTDPATLARLYLAFGVE